MSKLNFDSVPMVDLKSQYIGMKNEIDEAIQTVINSTAFIKGKAVADFESALGNFLATHHVISCGNGTDALQMALMALELEQGDEVIMPGFSYAATAEVIALLKLKPVFIDVDAISFNINADLIENAITNRTKVIMPVHLFGQQCDMDAVMTIAQKHGLFVIEDNAQSIASKNKTTSSAAPIGHISCTSFFPSKNLGAYGDGGAIFTQDPILADKIRMIGNHGQSKKYYHDIIGINSRLDGIQAAILGVKLKQLDRFISNRQKAADYYDSNLKNLSGIAIPQKAGYSDHVYHQYTLQVPSKQRNEFVKYFKALNIATAIYYPLPLYRQKAYQQYWNGSSLPVAEQLCETVVSIPMHSEMNEDLQDHIIANIKYFFNK